jgi:hypothetical protein
MIEFIKSLQWVDFFYLVFTDPRKLMEIIHREEAKSLPIGFAGVALVSIMEILAQSLLGTETPFFYTKLTYGWILSMLVMALTIMVFASLIDSTSQMFGNPGGVVRIINIINFSIFPRVLLLPLVFIFRVFNFAPVFFYILFSIAFFIWSALIVIQGFSEMHTIPFARSVAIFVLPFVFIGLVFFFAFILLLISLVNYLSVL